MAPDPPRHMELTAVRAAAYAELFDDQPDEVFRADQLATGPDDPYLIDVFVYSFAIEGRGPDLRGRHQRHVGPALAEG